MNHSGNDRKALYRRLFKYAEHRSARTKMLSYLLHRLKNDELRDVLDLLDTDPECNPPRRGRQPRFSAAAEEEIRVANRDIPPRR